LPKREHRNPAPHRRANERGVVLDKADDLVAGRKSLRIRASIRKAGKLHGPVGELKGERIPALASPSLGNALPFQDKMLTPELAQLVAHRQAGLAAAHYDGFDLLVGQARRLPRGNSLRPR
jgi:hypothetical protein